MSLRTKINENPMLGGIIVVALLALAGLYMLYAYGYFSRTRVEVSETFVQERPVFITGGGQGIRPGLSTDILFPGPDGSPLVIAHMVQVGNGRPFVHYYERINPQTLEQLQKLPLFPTESADKQKRAQLEEEGREVQRPDDEQWVRASSPEGQQIINDVPVQNGQKATPVEAPAATDPALAPN